MRFMRFPHRTLACGSAIALLLLPPASRAWGADAVAQSMKELLRQGFADTAQSLVAEPGQACATVERHRQVFDALMGEYATRSGDRSFEETLRRWYLRYCGREPAAPPRSDD